MHILQLLGWRSAVFNMAVTPLSVLLCCCMTGIALALPVVDECVLLAAPHTEVAYVMSDLYNNVERPNPSLERLLTNGYNLVIREEASETVRVICAFQRMKEIEENALRLNNCPSLYSRFNSTPLSSQTIQFLRRSQCGFHDRTPLVCCVEPETQTSAAVIDREEPNQPSASFDLQSHPKARLLPLDTCGLDYSDRIWGGDVTGLDEFPWLALLQYRTRSGLVKFLCGGVLISKRYVLTAAHCLHLKELGTHVLTKVRLGEFDLESDPDCETDSDTGRQECAPKPQDFGIAESIPHPDYDPVSNNKHDDIGLVRLDQDVKLDTESVKPICLPPAGDLQIGRKLQVAGWGYTEKGISSHVKLKVEVPVVSTEECGRIYARRSRVIGQDQMCAGGVTGKDSCKGDSGGPLMDWAEMLHDGVKRYHVAGIVSYGLSSCGSTGWPGVYVKVFPYIPWILDTIEP